MTLGTYVEIVVTVPDIASGLAFYEALDFKKLAHDVVTEGCYILRLTTEKMENPTLNYYGSDLDAIKNSTVEWDENHTCLSPNGVQVVLQAEPAPYEMPSGEPLVRTPLSKLGRFGEHTIPVVGDMDRAFNFWLQLGFKQTHRSDEPYPWGIVMDEHIIIGLHQSENADDEVLQGDALTEIHLSHFAPDMIDRIEKVKALGCTIKDMKPLAEDGRAQNAQMTAPGGQKFYLFSGEI